MATIRAYTSIGQSKKLSEILPLESADMKWFFWKSEIDAPKLPTFGYSKTAAENYKDTEAVYLPCWSLAALLSIIRKTIGYTLYGANNVYMSCDLGDKPWKLETEAYDNEVDDCYEMIINLHEQNLL